VFHRPLLRLAALPLVVDEPAFDCDYVMLPLGSDDHELAVELVRSGQASRILLVRGRKRRCVELGLVPSDLEFARRQMVHYGASAELLVPIGPLVHDRWEMADYLNKWLQDHPKARVVVLEERFESRRLRRILDRTLDPACAARVRVRGVANRIYDENDWWRKRAGLKHFVRYWLRLAFDWWRGRPDSYPGDGFDPDRYEQELARLAEGMQ